MVLILLEENSSLEALSITDLKNILTKSNKSIFVFWVRATINRWDEEAKRFGNARAYKSAMGALKKFNRKEKLRFEEISYTYLKRFETAHFKKGNSLNGLSMYMRTIRAIYNKAIHQGMVSATIILLKKYKIKSQATAKRAISKDKVKRILDLE